MRNDIHMSYVVMMVPGRVPFALPSLKQTNGSGMALAPQVPWRMFYTNRWFSTSMMISGSHVHLQRPQKTASLLRTSDPTTTGPCEGRGATDAEGGRVWGGGLLQLGRLT